MRPRAALMVTTVALVGGMVSLIPGISWAQFYQLIYQRYQLICSYAGGVQGQGLGPGSPLAVRIVGDVARSVGVNPVAIYRGGVPNAGATMIPGRGPAIVYNQDFLNRLVSANSWAPVSALAHELGHHINLDTSWYGQFRHPWTKELQADSISGCALARLGASPQDAMSAQLISFNMFGNASHPDTPRRLAAIQQGWLRCGGTGSITPRY